ncbi:hypothetical protein L218DRAFT_515808 [Marasmius fiardii PR-910]|nr:hypothetical protein L218DRAFT_515808 [Marasmius fiardii PR-910]
MGEFTTCMPATIPWSAGGPKLPITITITDIGVTQSAPPSSPSATGKSGTNTFSNIATAILRRAVGDGLTMFAIGQSVNSALGSYTWSSVNVSQGWYQLIAQTEDLNFVGHSQPIFVRNGTDTSCIDGASPSSTQSSQSQTSTFQPTDTNTSPPSTGAIESRQLNVGAIVGGVVGGVVVLLALFACGCMWRRRKTRTSAAVGNANDKGSANDGGSRTGVLPFGKWGKLGSGSFNDKDRAPAIGHRDDMIRGTAVSAVGIGRPRSHSGSGGGFLAGVLKPSTTQSPKKTKPPPSSKKKQYRHNSHTESIGGMLSSSATTSTSGSSAFHGTDDDYLYNYERHVPMSPISAGGSSAASSVRNTGNVGAVRSPFSDPSDNDSDSVVYGLYGTTRNSNTGVIPIGYDGPSISSAAHTPSPVPSSYQYDSSTGAVVGHSSDSEPPSRRNSRGHPDRLYPYTSFRDSRDQQDRVRAHTLLGGMYTHPNSHQQSLPETPRNDSLLTFTSSSSIGGGSKQGKKTRSKSLHESNPSSSELYDMSTTSSPQASSLPTPTAVQASPSIQSATVNVSSGNLSGGTFGASTTRRTPRKPVPSYSPDDLAGLSVAGGSSSAFTSPASSPTMQSPLTAGDDVVSEGQREVFRQHELLHKDSMGSMKGASKMHVLIPDMPPPQRHR